MQNIIRFTKGRIRRERVPSEDEVEQKRTGVFFETLRETLEKKEYARDESMLDGLLDQGFAMTEIAFALMHLCQPQENRADIPPAPEPAPARSYPKYEPQAEKRGRPAERSPRDSRPPRESHGPREPEPNRTSHEGGMVRIALNVGSESEIGPGDVVGVILGITKIPRESLGAIKVLPRETLADISEDRAEMVLQKLNNIRFKGRKLAARPA